MKSPENNLPRSEYAHLQITQAIQLGELKPGDRITEVEMTKWLEMSRTPVREALNKLESEGLIATLPHRGMCITQLDYQAVMELYQMREVLEATAAGLAAKHASEPEKAALKEILKRQESSLNDPQIQARQNRLFHNAIYHAAHNRYLLQSLNSLKQALILLGDTTYQIPGRSLAALKEHQEIFAAINSNDISGAEEATKAHIRAAQQARIKLLNNSF